MIHVETGGGEDQVDRVVAGGPLRGDQDGVGGFIEPVAVVIAEGGGVGQIGIDLDHVVSGLEAVERLHHLLCDVHGGDGRR